MRVYQIYGAYIHKSLVPFKDLFQFIDAFLKENDWTYRDVLFHFEISTLQADLDPLETFLEKYPYWREYSVTPSQKEYFHRFTNAPEMRAYLTSGRGQRQHACNHASFSLEKLLDLMSRVPRPLNFPDFVIRFDGIDWLQSGGDGYIKFERSIWPSGAKFEVTAEVEITDPNNSCQILDDSQIAKALNERFFGLIKKSDRRRFEFTNDEETRIGMLKREIEPMINSFQEQTKIKQIEYDDIDEHLAASADAAMTRFTVKKPLKTFFKGWEYRYEQPSVFFMRKIIKHGYRIEVLVYFKPGFTSELTREISISGLHFEFGLASGQILRSSQETIDDFIADCRRIADEAEQRFTEPLFHLYGETPAWFFQ